MAITANANMTVTMNQVENTLVAVTYGAAAVKVTIAAAVFISSQTNDAVFSEQDGSSLVNNGSILSRNASGVFFTGLNCSITNAADRSIAGGFTGIAINEGSATITNHGTVAGYGTFDFGVGVYFGADCRGGTLNNDGEVYGKLAGVFAISSFTGGVVHNSGMIRSDTFGIESTGHFVTRIDNAAGGIIRGTEASIFTDYRGSISLENRGRLVGDVDCNAAFAERDVVVNRGVIQGDVHLGLGADLFNGAAGASGKVFGEGGADRLTGSNRNDWLNGGADKDVLIGGLGRDVLLGGADADRFVFRAPAEASVATGGDRIGDFSRAQGDKIDVSGFDAKTAVAGNQAFAFIGTQAFHGVAGEVHIVKKAGYVIVAGDTNGDGLADFQIEVHNLTNNLTSLAAADFVL